MGHPARLSGRAEVVRHVTWFLEVENFRFYDLKVHASSESGSGCRGSHKIAFLREYFDPVRAAKALDTPILGFES